MTLKIKKFWGWEAGVIAFIGIVAWISNMEDWFGYGTGYSEDQRKNWNEMISATKGNAEKYAKCFINSPGSPSTMMRERTEKLDAWAWKLDIPDSLIDLPMEGKSTLALKHLTEGGGKGDACLELAARSCETGTRGGVPSGYIRDSKSFSFPSPQSIYEMETYLSQAVHQKRAGADFLLSLLEKRRKGEDTFHQESMPGYQSFLTCLDGGDFALGKVYLYLNPDGNEVLDRLAAGLRKKAEQGDVVALRNTGHLSLLNQLRGRPNYRWMIALSQISKSRVRPWTEMVMSGRDKMNSLLPKLSASLGSSEEFLCNWIETRAWRIERNNLENPLQILAKAADLGDLHAKFLWCQYVLCAQKSFAKEDWERYFRYTDEALRAGGFYAECWTSDYCFAGSLMFLIYKENNWRKVDKLIDKRKEREYARLFPSEAQDAALIRMSLESVENMEKFATGLISSIFSNSTYWNEDNGAKRKHACRLLESAAMEESPIAMLYFSMLLDDGTVIKENPSRAWELMLKLKSWCSKGLNVTNYLCLIHLKQHGNYICYGGGIDKVLAWQMLDFVSRRGDMPGMTVNDAFKVFVKDFYYHHAPAFRKAYKDHLSCLKDQFEKRGFTVPEEKNMLP